MRTCIRCERAQEMGSGRNADRPPQPSELAFHFFGLSGRHVDGVASEARQQTEPRGNGLSSPLPGTMSTKFIWHTSESLTQLHMTVRRLAIHKRLITNTLLNLA
jgi:hypothetical protein